MIVSNTSENAASATPVQIDASDAATAAAAPARYNAVAQWLHWLIGLAVLGQIALGWWMIGLPNTPPGYQAGWYNIHKSIGLSIGLLVLLRIVWRWRHPAPLLPATLALGLGLLVRRFAPPHLFVYILGRSFIATALAIMATGTRIEQRRHRIDALSAARQSDPADWRLCLFPGPRDGGRAGLGNERRFARMLVARSD